MHKHNLQKTNYVTICNFNFNSTFKKTMEYYWFKQEFIYIVEMYISNKFWIKRLLQSLKEYYR
jgi:hypothetical protein